MFDIASKVLNKLHAIKLMTIIKLLNFTEKSTSQCEGLPHCQASHAALRITPNMASRQSSGQRQYQHPCANPGICGAAVTGLFQIVLGCGSIAAGVVLILEKNDVIPIGFAIWGGGVVSWLQL